MFPFSSFTEEPPLPKPFSVQPGVSLSLSPAQGVFYLQTSTSYYQAGGGASFFLRMYPRVTGEVNLDFFVGTARDPYNGNVLTALDLSMGARIYLRALPKEPTKNRIFLPYLSVGPHLSILFPKQEDPWVRVGASGALARFKVPSALFGPYLGAFFAGGFELRWKEHWCFYAEVRFSAQGLLDPILDFYHEKFYSNTRLVAGLKAGIAWYF